MNIHNLVKTTQKKKRRLGQGHGSGRGKTSGRGTKGQNARGEMPLYFEGGALSLIKRLPFRRGKGKNKAFRKKAVIINVGNLNLLPKDSIVDIPALVKYHLITSEMSQSRKIKILGDGELIMPLTIKLPVSKGAAEKIKKAGGKIEV